MVPKQLGSLVQGARWPWLGCIPSQRWRHVTLSAEKPSEATDIKADEPGQVVSERNGLPGTNDAAASTSGSTFSKEGASGVSGNTGVSAAVPVVLSLPADDSIPCIGGMAAAAVAKAAANATAGVSSSGKVVAPPGEVGFPHRWKVVLLISLAFVLCNMDKVNMSVAVIPMAKELGWTSLERGLVSSSFFWGYTLTQMPGGYISTKIGGARVLMAGVALWSVGTLIAPPAAQISIWALCATRVLVGLGEGFAPSAATSVLAKIMPPNERSRAVSLVWGGLDVGSVVGLLLSGPLIRAYGWPSVFYLFAVLGFLWCVCWPMVKPEDPPAPEVNAQVALLASMEEPAENKPPEKMHVPWGAFFKSTPVWAITVAHFCFNWGYYVLLAWLPSYFELALGLNVQKSSFLTLIP